MRGRRPPRSRGGEPRLPVPPRPAQGPAEALPRASLGQPPVLDRRPARARGRRCFSPRRPSARSSASSGSRPGRRDRAERRHGAERGNRALGALVFGAGIGALATEITASRLLAPYFGSSTIVWANLIGIVLAALSLGYWLGGRIADRRPEPMLLGYIVLASAVFVAAIPFVAKPFLDVTVEGLDETSAGAVIGSFLAVLLLCAPPVVLLGMVSPFAIRLAVSSIATAGQVAGRLYALLDGGFAARDVPAGARPHPCDRDAADVPRRRGGARGLLLLSPRGGATWSSRRCSRRSSPSRPARSRRETGCYTRRRRTSSTSRSCEEDDGRRLLYLNEGIAVHSVAEERGAHGRRLGLVSRAPPLLGRELERVAILGNAAGTTARALGVYYPNAEIDGVELDPAVTRVGRRYFGLDDNPRLTVHDADARPFLRSTDEQYDLIVVDAYHQPYVPFYLATASSSGSSATGWRREGSSRSTSPRCRTTSGSSRPSVRRSMPSCPQVVEWPALRFNTLVLGLTAPLAPDLLRGRLASGPADLAPLRELLARDARPLTPSGRAVDRTTARRRVGDGPDDRLVRRRRRPARRGLPAHAAVGRRALPRTTRRTAALHRPSGRGGACAREHAALLPGGGRGRRRPHRVRRPRARLRRARDRPLARPARGQPRRGRRRPTRELSLAEVREVAPDLPTSRRRSASSWTRRPRSACTSTSRTEVGRGRAGRPPRLGLVERTLVASFTERRSAGWRGPRPAWPASRSPRTGFASRAGRARLP